jgi:hypothetical protein
MVKGTLLMKIVPPEHRWTAPKSAVPVRVADYSDGRVLSLVFQGEAAPTNNLRGQPGEEITADLFAFSFLWRVAITHGHFPDAERSVRHEIGEYIIALAQRLKYRFGE